MKKPRADFRFPLVSSCYTTSVDSPFSLFDDTHRSRHSRTEETHLYILCREKIATLWSQFLFWYTMIYIIERKVKKKINQNKNEYPKPPPPHTISSYKTSPKTHTDLQTATRYTQEKKRTANKTNEQMTRVILMIKSCITRCKRSTPFTKYDRYETWEPFSSQQMVENQFYCLVCLCYYFQFILFYFIFQFHFVEFWQWRDSRGKMAEIVERILIFRVVNYYYYRYADNIDGSCTRYPIAQLITHLILCVRQQE